MMCEANMREGYSNGIIMEANMFKINTLSKKKIILSELKVIFP